MALEKEKFNTLTSAVTLAMVSVLVVAAFALELFLGHLLLQCGS